MALGMPRQRYHGLDGAGNVEEVTQGLVRFADLTMQLSFPRTDWVLSLEAGEHIPHEFEMAYISNLHAHNCVGVMLSWAHLFQGGHGHVNNHGASYLIGVFDGLGYDLDDELTRLLRRPRPASRNNSDFGDNPTTPLLQVQPQGSTPLRLDAVLEGSSFAFRRREPLQHRGCHHELRV